MGTQLQSMAIDLPLVRSHPNRTEFRGVLTFVDVPSDKPPAGAKGHRVVLTREAAQAALPSLLGMALDYTPSLDRHDARCKIGVITSAEVVPAGTARPNPAYADHYARAFKIEVSGYLFARDFPEVIRELQADRGALGMSYEIADAHIVDMKAPLWRITQCVFTGAALLKRDKAAYRNTWIELAN